MSDPIQAIALTKTALEENASARWVLGFSGGKDSTALLKVFCSAYRKARPRPASVDIIYCDTGVENLLLDRYVKRVLHDLQAEFVEDGLPLNINILSAPVGERFFVKVIGRGYPPPTNSFRWCTKSLRIRPVARFIGQVAKGDAVVALGMRRSESAQRDRSLDRAGGGYWQDQREGSNQYRLFLPILDLDLGNVWDAVFMLPWPKSIDARELEGIYRGASGECPMIKAPTAPPCASGRFGCWTCTVVRKDKSAQALVDAGHSDLAPFLEFRNWLANIRNDPALRWPMRRSGAVGPGPFTLAARRQILERLSELEQQTGEPILRLGESQAIQDLWKLDQEIEISAGIQARKRRRVPN